MSKMKKLSLTLLLLMGLGSIVMANNVITTNEVTIRPDGTAELIVSLENDEDFNVYAYDFRLYLPDGIEVVKDASYVYALSGRHTDHAVNVQPTNDGAIQFGVSSPNAFLSGTNGSVLGIKLKADESLTEGTTLTGSIKKITYANKEAQTVHPDDMTFNIKIDNVVVLDENALLVPDATSDNVDIKVLRTIKANQWSTICLPFAMSAEKLKAAFGDDYELDYISNCESETDGDGNVTGINVTFTKRTTALQVNRPYIIKISKDITEFEVNAKINPSDAYKTEVTKEDDETGEDVLVCSMTGNLKAGTVVPKNSLFLSDNKFWYSVGKTKLKAFRAYFTFNDVLSSLNGAGVKMFFGDAETRVNDINGDEEESVYDLGGRKLADGKSDAHIRRGVYIVNGQKVVVK